jgi:hypothetical protein
MEIRSQMLLTIQPSGDTASELPLVTDGTSDQAKQEKKPL